MINAYLYFYTIRDTKKKFHENLAGVLDFALPEPPSVNSVKEDEEAECGICYAMHLPVGEQIYLDAAPSPCTIVPES